MTGIDSRNENCHGDMHYKDLLGSIARVGYCIPVSDLNIVLHGLQCRKRINGLI